MALLHVLLLIGAIGNSVPHIIFKEPPRFQVSRIAFNEWRPLRQSTGQLVRYPIYKKVYSPTKKDDLAVDGSDQIVQHFSPAPPSILGSLSVFGHATVKARQHAAQGAKNTRPALETRPALDTRTYYQSAHKHVAPYLVYKDPPKRPSSSQSTSAYRRQPYYSEQRSPNLPFQQTQSTSLAANSYYFDQQHPFIPSSRDHSFEKVRKPVAETYNLQYSIPTLDYQGLAFYNPNNYQEFYRNPFGDIRLGGDRETVHVDGPAEHVDPLYESVSLGKPFHHNGGITSTKPTGAFTPIVTTYSSLASSPATPAHPSKLSTIKFSQVAQPFQAVTSKPIVGNEFTESVYPLTVTTIDIPEAVVTENGNTGSKIDNLGSRIVNTASKIESTPAAQYFTPITTNSYNHEQVFNRHPTKAVIVSSEQPFLPTPATGPWSVPHTDMEINDEFTTQQQILDTTIDDGSEDENVATVMTTVTAPVESTTIKKIKSRRRPHRRPTSSTKPTYERITEESTTPIDFSKYNRRRKPVNKNYTNTDLKRLRTSTTTSTTTVAPIIEENTGFTTETEYITEPAIFTSSAVQNIEQTGQDTLNVVKFEETTPDTLKIISSTVEPSVMSSSTTTPATLATKIRIKYGNRPRFSVKDYRERLKMTSTTTAPDAGDPIRNRTDSKSKQRVATVKDDSSTEYSEVTTEPKYRYKPRLTPSRYKSSSTTPAPTDAETERVNAFRPSSNRYKSSGGKYYSRYRTSTASTRELEENQATSTARVTMKTKGVFSAKRRPFPFKQKAEETALTMEGSPTEFLKIKENEVIPSSPTKSAEELVTSMTTITSKEDHSADPTGEEATKIADLTSSSTNEFHQTSTVVKTNRPRPNILLPKDDPILPLEAFFQTQSKDS